VGYTLYNWIWLLDVIISHLLSGMHIQVPKMNKKERFHFQFQGVNLDIGMGLAQSGVPMDLFVGLILILTHYQHGEIGPENNFGKPDELEKYSSRFAKQNMWMKAPVSCGYAIETIGILRWQV